MKLKLEVHIHTCAKSVHRYITKKHNVKMMHNRLLHLQKQHIHKVFPYDHPHTLSIIMYVAVYQLFLHIVASMKHAHQRGLLEKKQFKIMIYSSVTICLLMCVHVCMCMQLF